MAKTGLELAQDTRFPEEFSASKIAKVLAADDRADPNLARIIVVATSDYSRTSEYFFGHNQSYTFCVERNGTL